MSEILTAVAVIWGTSFAATIIFFSLDEWKHRRSAVALPAITTSEPLSMRNDNPVGADLQPAVA